MELSASLLNSESPQLEAGAKCLENLVALEVGDSGVDRLTSFDNDGRHLGNP